MKKFSWRKNDAPPPIVNRAFTFGIAGNDVQNRWSGAVNEVSARRGRDWTEVAFSTPAAGARFGLDGRATNGVNAKPVGRHNTVRDLKARGRAGH